MSDYEDEMEVDAPAQKSALFNSDNTGAKGKRSAANLPVEAEDTLPWCVLESLIRLSRALMPYRVEKYRPNTLDDVEGHQDILATINKFVEANVGLASQKVRDQVC